MSDTQELSRDQVDALNEPTVIEFGATWCGYCQAAQPLITEALVAYPQVSHHKVEDGPGRRLGRSFKVKLWPTLIFLKQGIEVARCVRPTNKQVIIDGLQKIVEGIGSVAE